MKLLKQVILFIIFTGIIFGIFTLVTRRSDTIDMSSLNVGNHEQILSEILADWKGLTDWDEDTYNRQMTMVAQSYNAGILKEDDRKSLYDRVNKEAYTKAVDAMNREFALAGCDASKLASNYSGLQTIEMHEPAYARIPAIAEVTKVYNLYNQIIAFNKKSFGLSPRFNPATDQWNSWTGHQDRLSKQKADFLANPIFSSRLKHINDIKAIYSTDTKLADSRRDFYDKLSNEIAADFNAEISRINSMSANQSSISQSNASGRNLASRLTDIRIQLGNERYLSPQHPIFERMRSLSHNIPK